MFHQVILFWHNRAHERKINKILIVSRHVVASSLPVPRSSSLSSARIMGETNDQGETQQSSGMSQC
jgi:hypothetical protein